MGELGSLKQEYPGYISSREASRRFRLTNDYVSRLCRQGKIPGVFVGKVWYVEERSLKSFLEASASRQKDRSKKLSKIRQTEYQKTDIPPAPARLLAKDSFIPSSQAIFNAKADQSPIVVSEPP